MIRERIIDFFGGSLRRAMAVVLLILVSGTLSHIMAQGRAMERTYVRGGVVAKSGAKVKVDTLAVDSLALDSLAVDSLALNSLAEVDTLAQRDLSILDAKVTPVDSIDMAKELRSKFFTDSMSLSQVCWTAAVLPGYGQFYNKQYWKLPIMYTALFGGLGLFIHENKTYKPLKTKYNELIGDSFFRTEELNEVQNDMIRSNTRRQLYMGVALASYIYMLGDAAVNYATNDVSDIKRATTLATICPGAGQIYNKSYWKLPFVLGGFASMIYVVDWNTRGYKRFGTAYKQVSAYNEDPSAYPDGSPDEFSGRYDAAYLKNLRDQYRRNRDMSYVMMAGIYVLQIIDAHVDAHFKDFDISDDLAMDITPTVGYVYSPVANCNSATYGFSLGVKF